MRKVFLFTIILSLLCVSVFAKEYKLVDVQSTDYSYSDIQTCLNQGWMGIVKDKFYPDKPVTRSEFAVILTKFSGKVKDLAKTKSTSFKDVAKTDLNVRYIELNKDIIPNNKVGKDLYFKPNNYITREDALVSLVKIKGLDDDYAAGYGAAGNEIDVTEYIEDASKVSPELRGLIGIGLSNDLIDIKTIDGKDYLNPKVNISRRQLANLLFNANNVTTYNTSETSTDVNSVDATPAPKANPDEIISTMTNELESYGSIILSYGSAVNLANGQIWEITSFDTVSTKKANAKVTIYHVDGETAWSMLIDGGNKRVYVKKIK